MYVLQERIYIIYHIVTISWDVQILQELLYTEIQTRHIIYTETIILGLMNITILSPYKTSTLPDIYYFNNILKLFFIIWIWSTWFHVNLILHSLYFAIQKLSNMKLSYLLLERKLVMIYWMMKIFTIPYVIDTIPNSPGGHQLPKKAKKNVWIVSINR